MTFKDARSVLDTIKAGEAVERIRSANRTVVDNLFGGVKPVPDAVAKKMGLTINVQWGEGTVLFCQAVRNYTNAFQRPAKYFNILIPDAPMDKQSEWQQEISAFINRKMKNSNDYFFKVQYENSSVVSHGIGPFEWEDKYCWCPSFLPIRNLRVPTNTEVSFTNCEWFAKRVPYTEGELSDKVFSEDSSKKWNKPAVQKILDAYHDITWDPSIGTTWMMDPEKMASMIKQNGGFYNSDAVPTIPLWHFYFKNVDKKNGKVSWRMRVVAASDDGCQSAPSNEFLYDGGDTSYADDLSQILQCQFGDLNTDAPFLYHAVRGLGFMLVEPCFYTNLARCRMLQHLFENFNTWFRVTDPTGKQRALEINLFDKCIVPEGVQVVPQTERHHVDPAMLDMAFGQLKQLQGEASSSYTQQSDTGTSREQTAFETSVKLQQVTAMSSGMILVAFFQKKFEYMEICRRFCIKGSKDKDVREFQAAMRRKGIPVQFLDHKLWEIDPEIPLGIGNPTMEITQSNQLQQLRGQLSPEAQQRVTHMSVAAITQNPAMAKQLAPLSTKPLVTDGAKWASSIFGTLMQGVPVPQNESVPALEQVDTLLGLMSGVMVRIGQDTNLATPNELLGLMTVAAYVAQLNQQVAGDPSNQQAAKENAQTLGKLMNVLKGFQQRLEQQQAQGDGPDPEAIAKAQSTMLLAKTKAGISQQNAAQKQAQKHAGFTAEEQRKNAAFMAQQQREGVATGAKLHRDSVETGAAIQMDNAANQAEIEMMKRAEAITSASQDSP